MVGHRGQAFTSLTLLKSNIYDKILSDITSLYDLLYESLYFKLKLLFYDHKFDVFIFLSFMAYIKFKFCENRNSNLLIINEFTDKLVEVINCKNKLNFGTIYAVPFTIGYYYFGNEDVQIISQKC